MADLPDGIEDFGATLSLHLLPGESVFLRRSSLILAEGPFKLETRFVAARRFSVIGQFSGQVRWANHFTAEAGEVHLLAGRDHAGHVLGFRVAPDAPVWISPGAYLGHQGELTLNTERVGKKEFWTLTKISGEGRVWIKVHGEPQVRALQADGAVTDSNYVAAILGAFTAYGRVFKASELMRSGELENVRLAGTGHVVFQSENPEERAGANSGGGIGGLIRLLLPF